MKERGIRAVRIHYASIQAVYWSVCAIFMVFVVPLLRDRGFQDAQIGILLAIRSFSCILLQPLIAAFMDRHADTIPLKYTIAVIVAVSFLTTVLFLKIKFGFWGSMVIFAFLGASITALSPLYNSLAMQYLAIGWDLKYSLARGCGSISYAVFCIVLGYMVDFFGISSTLYLQAVMLIISFLVVITFRVCNSSEIERSSENCSHTNWQVILNNKAYRIFLTASVLLFVGNNMTTSFLVDVVDKLGGTNKDVGYCQFILAAVEFPIALCFIKLKNKIGTLNIMRISAVFIFIKTFGIFLAPNIPVLIGVHAFQMLGAGLYWSGSVYYVNENIPKEDGIKGQSLVAIFSTGIGSGVGALISGWISQRFSIDVLIFIGVLCTLFGTCIMFHAMKISNNTKELYMSVFINS